jgi:hypothetical protein
MHGSTLLADRRQPGHYTRFEVTSGYAVTRPEPHFAPTALDSILGRFSTNRADKVTRHLDIEECPDLDVEFRNRAASGQPDSGVP